MVESYSMRKIPVINKEDTDIFLKEDTDKIKIIEISNFIDAWEKEILFSENGFYSLKGKSVENKTKEFLDELEQLVNNKIYEIHFSSQTSKEIISDIKKKKIEAIKTQMFMYEQTQMKNWEFEVYENAIKSCINRAVLYKNNSEIINSSFKNGLSIINTMSEKEQWSSKTLSVKKSLYESEFFFELINSFIISKDAKVSFYFNKYKDKLKEKDKEVLEDAINMLKNNVIAYNWAKELFSYELSEAENEKEIKEVKDKELQALIRKYLEEFLQQKKKSEEIQNQEKNEKNWKEIISVLESEPDKAELYIDYTLSKESINAKKSYIKNKRKYGYIDTDKASFIKMAEMMVENYQKFKNEPISNLRKNLSAEDYSLIEKLRSLNESEYNFFLSDYNYIQSKVCPNILKDEDNVYSLVKMVLTAKDSYVSIKKEEPDIEKRNKLIEAVIERYSDKK